ncbi:aminoglycoside phosphotransferase family protein [Phenylobacterium sp.]|uniref:aminoglycoside phosphotransferase family protein n=1 Tax=Phenylobacterium sp. TaxID=1871053 RepID=UPI0025D2A453|nr:aminoglycoside phosphotransferase family protein [Phenylobacterium sp.]
MTGSDPFAPWLARWRLVPDGEPFTTRFGSRLAPVLADGAPAMLKIAGHEEERRGGALMEWWAGRGAARVLAREGDALLMERLAGPRSLAAMARSGADDEATAILCGVARGLHAPRPEPAPDTLVPLDRWFRSLRVAAARDGGPFSRALPVAERLLAEPRDVVVLHGDFHHDNVLDGGARGWLAIDPKGLIGERGFEYANLFRTPDAEIALEPGRMARRAAIVARAADLDLRRLCEWIFVYAALGAAWSIESGHDPGPGLAIAECGEALAGA